MTQTQNAPEVSDPSGAPEQAGQPSEIVVVEQPYQLLPPLSGEEYAALRADIEAHGVLVPVDVDEDGQVLDGHHRRRIADELGIDCPVRVVAGLTEEDKRHRALALNLVRRHLTQGQRRDLVAAELAYDDSRSDRAIRRVVGVDGKTVAAVRRSLAGAESPQQLSSLGQSTEAEARERTERIRRGLADIDDCATALVADGLALEAARFLMTGMDDLLSWRPGDFEWQAGIRVIFEPRIREVLRADG